MGDDLFVSKNGSTTRQLRIIQNFVTHPAYDPDTLENDIALIRVNSEFLFPLLICNENTYFYRYI